MRPRRTDQTKWSVTCMSKCRVVGETGTEFDELWNITVLAVFCKCQ
jgi:hypothetical protein